MNNKLRSVSLMFCFIYGITSCNEIRNEDVISLSRIKADQPGIIGEYNFITNPPEFLKTAFAATGIVGVYDDETNAVVGAATGLYVKDTATHQHYILTAAHAVYDFKSKKIKGRRVSFGYIHDGFKYGFFTLDDSVFAEDAFNLDKDWIFIPVPASQDRVPFEIDRAQLSNIPIDDFKKLRDDKLFAVSTVSTGDKRKVERFYQTRFTLDDGSHIGPSFMVTNLDLIYGMSGSPIFYRSQNELILLGIATYKNRQFACAIYSHSKCYNVVSIID